MTRHSWRRAPLTLEGVNVDVAGADHAAHLRDGGGYQCRRAGQQAPNHVAHLESVDCASACNRMTDDCVHGRCTQSCEIVLTRGTGTATMALGVTAEYARLVNARRGQIDDKTQTWTSRAGAGSRDAAAMLETYTMWSSLSVSAVPLPVDSSTKELRAVRFRCGMKCTGLHTRRPSLCTACKSSQLRRVWSRSRRVSGRSLHTSDAMAVLHSSAVRGAMLCITL